MVHARCVSVVSIHLSRTWMTGSFESMRWNTCMHRQDLSLYSHPKDFFGNGVRTHVNSKGKIPSTGKVLLLRLNPRRCITLDSKPNTLPFELFWPPSEVLNHTLKHYTGFENSSFITGASTQMIHIHHTYKTAAHSSPLHTKNIAKEWLHKSKLSHNPVTLNEGHGHSSKYHAVECLSSH